MATSGGALVEGAVPQEAQDPRRQEGGEAVASDGVEGVPERRRVGHGGTARDLPRCVADDVRDREGPDGAVSRGAEQPPALELGEVAPQQVGGRDRDAAALDEPGRRRDLGDREGGRGDLDGRRATAGDQEEDRLPGRAAGDELAELGPRATARGSGDRMVPPERRHAPGRGGVPLRDRRRGRAERRTEHGPGGRGHRARALPEGDQVDGGRRRTDPTASVDPHPPRSDGQRGADRAGGLAGPDARAGDPERVSSEAHRRPPR